MRARGRARVFTSVTLILCVAGVIGCSRPASRAHTVEIRNFVYLPPVLTVSLGDTVVWANRDVVPHTVTARGKFDSGSMDASATWSHVAAASGEFSYDCTFHPNMRGVLTVR